MVAQAFGIHHPTRARALILSNTAAKIGTPESWQARITAIETDGIASIADTILDRWFPQPFRASPDALPWRTMLLRADPVGYVQTCRALARADLRAGLATVDPARPVHRRVAKTNPPRPHLVAETAALITGAQLVEIAGLRPHPRHRRARANCPPDHRIS